MGWFPSLRQRAYVNALTSHTSVPPSAGWLSCLKGSCGAEGAGGHPRVNGHIYVWQGMCKMVWGCLGAR